MAEVVFEQVPTGRTHQVKGEYVPILAESGEPETEWVLAAIVDGHRVPLQSFNVGYVEHMVSRDDTAVDQGASSTSETPDAGGDQAELERLRARVAELEQQTGAGAGGEQPTEQTGPAAGDQPPQQ